MAGTTRNCHENKIREALHNRLRSTSSCGGEAVVLDELGIRRGGARIDLAVVNGRLHGYEIKSDRDNLRRLGSQMEIYNGVFDRVTLVCSQTHVDQALQIIPNWWGLLQVLLADCAVSFETIRPGELNPSKDGRALAELLWREEAMSLLDRRGALRGLRGKPREHLWDRVSELFTIEEVAEAVRKHLTATATLRGRPALRL